MTPPYPLRSVALMPAKTAKRPASSAVEDYLERILELINTKGYARVADIARSLDISQRSEERRVGKECA